MRRMTLERLSYQLLNSCRPRKTETDKPSVSACHKTCQVFIPSTGSELAFLDRSFRLQLSLLLSYHTLGLPHVPLATNLGLI
jgi:hypothetical protein